MRVRKVELLLVDGVVVLEADGTAGYVHVTLPSGRQTAVNLVDQFGPKPTPMTKTKQEFARCLLALDGNPNPTNGDIVGILDVIAPVIW